jgi:hypothetical protein
LSESEKKEEPSAAPDFIAQEKLWRLCEEILVEFKALNANFAIVTSKLGDCSLALQEIARIKREYSEKMAKKEGEGSKPAESGRVIALLGKTYGFRDDLKDLGAAWQEVTDESGRSVRAWCIPIGEFTAVKREKVEELGIPQLRIVEAKKL